MAKGNDLQRSLGQIEGSLTSLHQRVDEGFTAVTRRMDGLTEDVTVLKGDTSQAKGAIRVLMWLAPPLGAGLAWAGSALAKLMPWNGK